MRIIRENKKLMVWLKRNSKVNLEVNQESLAERIKRNYTKGKALPVKILRKSSFNQRGSIKVYLSKIIHQYQIYIHEIFSLTRFYKKVRSDSKSYRSKNL